MSEGRGNEDHRPVILHAQASKHTRKVGWFERQARGLLASWREPSPGWGNMPRPETAASGQIWGAKNCLRVVHPQLETRSSRIKPLSSQKDLRADRINEDRRSYHAFPHRLLLQGYSQQERSACMLA